MNELGMNKPKKYVKSLWRNYKILGKIEKNISILYYVYIYKSTIGERHGKP